MGAYVCLRQHVFVDIYHSVKYLHIATCIYSACQQNTIHTQCRKLVIHSIAKIRHTYISINACQFYDISYSYHATCAYLC